jgi:hypothetical protein
MVACLWEAPLYARSNIPEYWVVDLEAAAIWCHSSPEGGTYRTVRRLGSGERLAPMLLPDCSIASGGLLGR